MRSKHVTLPKIEIGSESFAAEEGFVAELEKFVPCAATIRCVPWNKHDLDIIKRYYPRGVSIKLMLKYLERPSTVDSVQSQARRLGLSWGSELVGAGL